MAWAALGGGGLFTATDERSTRLRAALAEVGEPLGLSIGATALAWVLRHPSGPVPVLGTSNPERMGDLAAAVDVVLDRQDWFTLLQAARGEEVA